MVVVVSLEVLLGAANELALGHTLVGDEELQCVVWQAA